jgi:putative PIN family toxin of toxin-antitoxin system
MPPRAVFDCSLFLQAATSAKGPAFKCFTLVEQSRVVLLLSEPILDEIEDVFGRPMLQAKFPILKEEPVRAFIRKVKRLAVLCSEPPNIFILPRDRDDEPYTDLAIAARARYLVTWNDRHLTYLMRQDTPEGTEFCRRFPELRIVSPPEFIREISTMDVKI